MQILNILLCVALVFSPVIAFMLISENKKWGLALVPIGLVFLLIIVAMFIGDFHIAAIILQLVIPYIVIVSAVGLIVWVITLLAKKRK